MAQDAPIEKVVVVVNGSKVILDPANMKYNENTLSDYMNREYGWIDYLGKQLEYAQKELLLAEIDSESIYSKKFIEAKESGKSDNYAKAFAMASQEYIDSKKKIVDRKEAVGHLKAHLKAWDKNHENSQNRGHSLRQEMKMLNRDIYEQVDNNTCNAEDFK
jgi:hypothetical protein